MEPDNTHTACLNCGAPLSGEFCSQCGQARYKGRLTLARLFYSLPERIFNIERGIFFTFWQLCRFPGRTARDFVNAKRAGRVNPVSYFVIGATVQLIALFFNQDALKSNLETQLIKDPTAVQRFIEKFGQEKGIQVYVDTYFAAIQQAYTYLALLFMVIPFAVFLWGLSRRQRRQFNLAETFVFSLYTVGHVILVTGLLVFVTVHISSTLHSILSLSLYLIYTLIAARHFYDRQHLNYIASFLSLLFATVCFILSIGVSFVIYSAKQLI